MLAAVPALATAQPPLVGFNQNWSMLPSLTTPRLLGSIRALAPQVLRYPGGTVSHDWDWESGTRVHKRASTVEAPHTLKDLKTVVDATGADVIFVLDIVNRDLDDQIRMLRTAESLGIPVHRLELGNELYAKDKGYEARFPDGKAYAAAVRTWSQKLRAAFPKARIASLLLMRDVDERNERMARWNADVTAGTAGAVDAYTLHVYIPARGNLADTTARFADVTNDPAIARKPLWITEYGNMHASGDANYLADLEALADFLERDPHVAIVLNHQIVGGKAARFAKLDVDGKPTAEGDRYVARARKRSAAANEAAR
ncbi:MAG TPA: glycosyl hydrolase [Tahibacter sp.]|nr:glycosyl hydrolase [Tahibacter sp.]